MNTNIMRYRRRTLLLIMLLMLCVGVSSLAYSDSGAQPKQSDANSTQIDSVSGDVTITINANDAASDKKTAQDDPQKKDWWLILLVLPIVLALIALVPDFRKSSCTSSDSAASGVQQEARVHRRGPTDD